MIIVNYKSLEHLQSKIGQYLEYQETNVKRKCYNSNGSFTVSNRPAVTGNRNLPEFWAVVTMKDGKIYKVE
jgi:hypothetical protein